MKTVRWILIPSIAAASVKSRAVASTGSEQVQTVALEAVEK